MTETVIPSLGRVWQRLLEERRLTIGYFGGSITEGACASDPSKTSWRALTTAWFRAQFPGAVIQEINAGVGGTGSDLGAFRCQRDLLAKRPNLVFVEFAVNDFGAPASRLNYYEGVIRQILKANPATDIVLVFAVTKQGDSYPAGKTPGSVAAEQAVARHYGLPTVNPGQAMSQQIQEGAATWESLTQDNVHPNDKGYRLFAQTVTTFLQAHRGDAALPPRSLPLPPPLNPAPVETGVLVDAWETDGAGWQREPESLADRCPHRIASATPGATLTFRFCGTGVGLYWLVAPDSGMIEYAIDGGISHTASSWDEYALQFTRANYRLLAEQLPEGSHVLELKVSAEKDPRSAGHWIRIGAFLVK